MNVSFRRELGLALLLALLFAPSALHAYGGPGSLVTGVGALLAVLAAIFAAIFGFLWFPVKRLVKKFRGGGDQEGVGTVEPQEECASE
jgi:hypothetical protein